MTTYNAGCHCGQIRLRFEFDGPLLVRECNCSICQMVGYLHLILPRDQVQFVQGEDRLSTYRFNTGVAAHLFCPECGVKPAYVPRSHPDGLSVNARCIDDVPLEALTIEPFDGANWEKMVHTIQ